MMEGGHVVWASLPKRWRATVRALWWFLSLRSWSACALRYTYILRAVDCVLYHTTNLILSQIHCLVEYGECSGWRSPVERTLLHLGT